MSDSKFTKGEWYIEKNYITTLEVSSALADICSVECDYREFQIVPTDEQRANAHLIASAPDMYKMIERVSQLRDLEGDYAINWLLDNTDNLINLLSKARG